MILYRVTNLMNGKKYIGITRSSVGKRWKQHCYYSRKQTTLLAKAIAKYGADAFTIEVVSMHEFVGRTLRS